ncbi:integrin-linked protein kinase family [Artemisia annua]|uniref:Integrin-linked protein kinase family n=1 Tax=Artemisia annua TaxID=35608 RepID=A0A2U1QL83_ARTAN|nr:integrin-linked protein kinase family [Artemisia annua]
MHAASTSDSRSERTHIAKNKYKNNIRKMFVIGYRDQDAERRCFVLVCSSFHPISDGSSKSLQSMMKNNIGGRRSSKNPYIKDASDNGVDRIGGPRPKSAGIYDVFGNSSEVCFCTILKVSKRVKQGRNMSYHDTTWTYVAPEVFRSEDYNNTVDGFSFALILQEELELCNKEWECIVASQGERNIPIISMPIENIGFGIFCCGARFFKLWEGQTDNTLTHGAEVEVEKNQKPVDHIGLGVHAIQVESVEKAADILKFTKLIQWQFFLHLRKVAITFRSTLAHNKFLSSACSSSRHRANEDVGATSGYDMRQQLEAGQKTATTLKVIFMLKEQTPIANSNYYGLCSGCICCYMENSADLIFVIGAVYYAIFFVGMNNSHKPASCRHRKNRILSKKRSRDLLLITLCHATGHTLSTHVNVEIPGHGTTEFECEDVETVCGVIDCVNKLVYVRTLRARIIHQYVLQQKCTKSTTTMEKKPRTSNGDGKVTT